MGKIEQKLLEAQRQIAPIVKDSNNPFYHSKYFDINKILEEVVPVLNKLGLVVLQPLEGDGIKTSIIDSDSGEKVESFIKLPSITTTTTAKTDKGDIITILSPDPQKMGSAITYYRRYSLQSLLALQAEDDDANIASQPSPKAQEIVKKWGDSDNFLKPFATTPLQATKTPPTSVKPAKPILSTIPAEKVKALATRFNINAEGLKSLVKGKYNRDSIETMPDEQRQGVMDWIKDFSETNPDGTEYKRDKATGKIVEFIFPPK